MNKQTSLRDKIFSLDPIQTSMDYERLDKTKDEIVRKKGWYVPSIHERYV